MWVGAVYMITINFLILTDLSSSYLNDQGIPQCVMTKWGIVLQTLQLNLNKMKMRICTLICKMLMDWVDSVHGVRTGTKVHGQCPLSPWTFPLSPWILFTESMDIIHSVYRTMSNILLTFANTLLKAIQPITMLVHIAWPSFSKAIQFLQYWYIYHL